MTTFVCFRVTVTTDDAPLVNLRKPWLDPEPQTLVDEFQVREAAVECARLASRGGADVKCELVTKTWGPENAESIDWREPVKKPVRKRATRPALGSAA